MSILESMIQPIIVGAIILIIGNMLYRRSDQSMKNAVLESLVWGFGFIFALCTECAIIETI